MLTYLLHKPENGRRISRKGKKKKLKLPQISCYGFLLHIEKRKRKQTNKFMSKQIKLCRAKKILE